jgi:hypothetical protein
VGEVMVVVEEVMVVELTQDLVAELLERLI